MMSRFIPAFDSSGVQYKCIVSNVSMRLTEKYGKGFSVTNLQYFRKFYQIYPDRLRIQHPLGAEFVKSDFPPEISRPTGVELIFAKKNSPAVSESKNGFHPNLSWSHYRALMRVSNDEARRFYEMEAAECGWSKAQLERQTLRRQGIFMRSSGLSWLRNAR